MAAIYRHIRFGFDSLTGLTGVAGRLLPNTLPVVAFETCDDDPVNQRPKCTTSYRPGRNRIVLSVVDSEYAERASVDHQANFTSDCPINCEWHELAHALYRQYVATSSTQGTAHAGFLNAVSQDSFDEGFAVFWGVATAEVCTTVTPFNGSGIPAECQAPANANWGSPTHYGTNGE